MRSTLSRLRALKHLRTFVAAGLLGSLLSVISISPANANVAITEITSSNWQTNTGTTFATTTLNGSRTGWTVMVQANEDDEFRSLPLPAGFTSTFNGTSYSSIFPGSNTYITFGQGSRNYSGLSASNPNIPGVHMCAKDNSWQLFMYRWQKLKRI
jgi:hypothetical protein